MIRIALAAAWLALASASLAWAQDEDVDAAPAGDVVPDADVQDPSSAPPQAAPPEVAQPETAPAQAPPARSSSADEALNAADAPQYRVKVCCDLCPRAADPAAYNTSKYFQDSALLQQGKEGWLFRSKLDLNSNIQISDESLIGLKRLVDTLHKVGTELVLVYQPPRALADPDKLTPAQRKSFDFRAAKQSYVAAMARLRTTGAVVPPFEKLIAEDKGYEYFFRRDHHWTPAGSEKTAQITAETVRSLPAFQGVPQKTFKTHLSGIISKPGSLQKIAQQICGGTYSMQFTPGYATEPEGGGGGGLLDNDVTPEITLVGTSNSDDRGGYNFGGYLEQSLHADVLNVAITGGSFEGSLLKYLPSEAFQKHPPRIIVWEMPYQDFPGTAVSPHRIFRQAVALVGNGCAGKPAVLEKTANLHAGSNEILFNGGGKVQPIVGDKYVMDFQFSDPAVKEFHSTVWYMNSMRERLQLRFKQYVDNKGRFVAELRNDRPEYAQATFMGATVDLPEAPAKPLSVTAKVCPLDVSMTAANAKRGGSATAAKETPASAPVSAMEATPTVKSAATIKAPPPPIKHAAPSATPKAPVPTAKSSSPGVRTGKPAVTYSTGKADTPAAPPEKSAVAPEKSAAPPEKSAAAAPAKKTAPKPTPAKRAASSGKKKTTPKPPTTVVKKPAPDSGHRWQKGAPSQKQESSTSLPDEPGADWSVTKPK